MKASDVILQMQSTLPGLTNMFTSSTPVTSLSRVGATISAVTSTPHSLSIGNYVYLYDASRQTAVTTATRVGTIVTVVTSTPHDLTQLFFTDVKMIGFTTTDYNGTFPLLTVPNRYTFTIRVPNTLPLSSTGPGMLLEPWRYGFNGWHQVATVGSTTTFTYAAGDPDSFTGTAYGTSMEVRSSPRITGAASLERAIASYTKFGANLLWSFVVLGPVKASKTRYSMLDPISANTSSAAFRQFMQEQINVYVFVPMTQSISGRSERDMITDVGVHLFKSVLGKVYKSYFVDQPTISLAFVRHEQSQYQGAYYIHLFEFEAVSEITDNDIVEPDFTRAFRDMNVRHLNEFNVTTLSTNINIDDKP